VHSCLDTYITPGWNHAILETSTVYVCDMHGYMAILLSLTSGGCRPQRGGAISLASSVRTRSEGVSLVLSNSTFTGNQGSENSAGLFWPGCGSCKGFYTDNEAMAAQPLDSDDRIAEASGR
jgi:hypothetical protein